MLSLAEAQKLLLELARPIGVERVGLERAAGRVLREHVAAPGDLPPFDLSAMDGYAVRSADGAGPLRVQASEARAGGGAAELEPGCALRIFTGAPIPGGADAVIMQEMASRDGDRVSFSAAARPGQHVRHRGEDLRAGHVVLEPGDVLSAAKCALLASLDRIWVNVSEPPVVAVLATGDELRNPGEQGNSASIAESNGIAIATMARGLGALARIVPIVRDDPEVTRRAIEDGLARSHLLVTVGGVSVGDHDYVRPALEAAGVRIAFHKVSIKPGKPVLVGERAGTLVLGLPGNPASAMITFGLFGAPALRALQGRKDLIPPPLRARLAHRVEHSSGRLELARAVLERRGDELYVRVLPNQASGAIVAMAKATCLLRLPAERGALDEDEWVDVDLLSENAS